MSQWLAVRKLVPWPLAVCWPWWGAFPAAALIGLVYRFPVPFVGYTSGLEAVFASFVAVLVYGVAGGFPLLAVLGAICGWLASRLAGNGSDRTFRLTVALALLVDLLAVLTLAVLDKIIGPW